MEELYFCRFKNKTPHISFKITAEEALLFLDLPLGRFYAIKGIDLGFGFEKRKINRTLGKGGRGALQGCPKSLKVGMFLVAPRSQGPLLKI